MTIEEIRDRSYVDSKDYNTGDMGSFGGEVAPTETIDGRTGNFTGQPN